MPKISGAKFTSGTRAGKKRAKRIRRRRLNIGVVPQVQNQTEFNKFMEVLYRELTRLNDRVEELEVRVNNMQVDPVTKVVTFPDA